MNIQNFETQNGKVFDIPLSYQLFGKELHSAPIVLINHALTGNSDVAGENGWWKSLVGEGKVIDNNRFTIISFNIPGNGFDGFFVDNYEDFTVQDVAEIFLEGLKYLKIEKLFALVGGSIGGSIGWEMLTLENNLAEKFIPIATDFKTSDWLHSQCLVQKYLLESEEKPLEKARVHAMLCYRTPESLNSRFNREKDYGKQILKSHDWLNFHGKRLNERFSLKAYKLVNHLLMNINGNENELENINAEIHLISVDSDLFYPAFEIKNTYQFLLNKNKNVQYHEIKSIHGHDAFLMEYEQLNNILTPLFLN
nr:alpha/beta fold hydrolase [Epilithonimonas mollis]